MQFLWLLQDLLILSCLFFYIFSLCCCSSMKTTLLSYFSINQLWCFFMSVEVTHEPGWSLENSPTINVEVTHEAWMNWTILEQWMLVSDEGFGSWDFLAWLCFSTPNFLMTYPQLHLYEENIQQAGIRQHVLMCKDWCSLELVPVLVESALV